MVLKYPSNQVSVCESVTFALIIWTTQQRFLVSMKLLTQQKSFWWTIEMIPKSTVVGVFKMASCGCSSGVPRREEFPDVSFISKYCCYAPFPYSVFFICSLKCLLFKVQHRFSELLLLEPWLSMSAIGVPCPWELTKPSQYIWDRLWTFLLLSILRI